MDFCDVSVGTTVRASQVSLDDHEVDNLIATDPNRRRRGFLVETFIKPPVDVIFELPCNVDVSSIVLRPTVGSQRSTGFDLFSITGSITPVDGQYFRFRADESSARTVIAAAAAAKQIGRPPQDNRSQHETKLLQNQNSAAAAGQSERALAKGQLFEQATINGHQRDIIIFVNKQFRPRPPFQDIISFPESADFGHQCRSSSRVMSASAARNIRAVKIRIWRTANGSVPALGSVHIYGIPAVGVKRSTVDRLWTQLVNSKRKTCGSLFDVNPAVTPCVNNLTTLDGSADNNDDQQQQDVPAAFMDPLTYDIMILPVILPSGNTVDQRTLDRFISAEASWGRSPSDPFTGIGFSSQCKPVSNVALKAEIDRFLIRNEHLVCGRTTGRKRDHDHQCMTATSSNSDHKPFQMGSSTKRQINDEVPSERTRTAAASTSAASSLEQTLRATLEALPSYTGSGRPSATRRRNYQPALDCAGCSKPATSQPLYKLPCSHVVCRQCMMRSIGGSGSAPGRLISCPQCSLSFVSSDAIRIHTSS